MRINPKYKLRSIAGKQIVLMQGTLDVDLTKAVALNPTACYLWNALQGRDFSSQDIIDLLLEKYDLTPQLAESEAQRWMELLGNLRLIVCC